MHRIFLSMSPRNTFRFFNGSTRGPGASLRQSQIENLQPVCTSLSDLANCCHHFVNFIAASQGDFVKYGTLCQYSNPKFSANSIAVPIWNPFRFLPLSVSPAGRKIRWTCPAPQGLPICVGATSRRPDGDGAGDRDRTGDIQLGKLTFCH